MKAQGDENQNKGNSGQKPDLYSYHDYRSFLQDWIEYRKQFEKGFRLSFVARKANITSSYLSRVLNGHTGFSEKTWETFVRLLRLKREEISFLNSLRQLSDGHHLESRIEALRNLKNYPLYRERHKETIQQARYLTHWYYVAIREMVQLPDFKLDPKWIQARLVKKLGITEIRSAIKFLVNNEYIEPTKDGSAKLTDPGRIVCDGGVYKVALAHFHREILGLCQETIDLTKSEEKALLGHAIAIQSSQMDSVRDILNRARDEIAKLAEEPEASDPDQVEFVYLLSFPLTNRGKKNEK